MPARGFSATTRSCPLLVVGGKSAARIPYYDPWRSFEVVGTPYANAWPKTWSKEKRIEAEARYAKLPEEFYTKTSLPVVIPDNCLAWLLQSNRLEHFSPRSVAHNNTTYRARTNHTQHTAHSTQHTAHGTAHSPQPSTQLSNVGYHLCQNQT